MKKNLKSTVLALALAASVTGAFASDIAHAISGKKLANYTWQRYNRNQTTSGLPFAGTQDTNITGCPGEEVLCAKGTPVDNPQLPVIEYFYD